MTKGILLLLSLALPLPALAGQPMSAREFEDYVTGRTLTYNAGGKPYGVEEYMPHHRVRWAFLGDDCVEGQWFEKNGQICFVYETDLSPQCWTFEREPGGLVARFQNDPNATEVYEAKQDDHKMQCRGPLVGS